MNRKKINYFKKELKKAVWSLNKNESFIRKYAVRITKLESDLSNTCDKNLKKNIENEFEQLSCTIIRLDEAINNQCKLIRNLSDAYLKALFDLE